jgi:RNA recognition motif-containing protein
LINEIHDLTDSVLFFSGFRSQASEEEIAKFFEEVGPVQKIDLRTHDNKSGSDSRGIGTVQFSRCRDAKRAVIMLDNKEYAGKRISLRNARERRHFPNGLANLGRPLPEPQVADQCRQQGIDPFQSADLFIGKLNSYDSSEDGLKEIFNFIGDCYRVNVLRFRDNDKKVSGAMARFSSALDAQQVINVLDNSIYLGKPFGCRFDRLITGGFKPQNDGDKKESPMMGKFQQENGVLPSEGNPEYKSNYIQATQMKQPGPFRNQENVQFAPGQYQQAMQPSMQQVMGHSMQQPMQQSLMQSQPNFGQFGQASNENRFQTNSSMNDYGFPTPNLGRPPPSAIYGSANTPVKRPNPYSSQIRDDTRSRSPLRKQQTGDDDDVQKLASRLGISKKMLNAIRVLANDEDDDATDQSKPETSAPTDNKN